MAKPTAAQKRYRRWIAQLPCERCGIEDDTRVAHHFTFCKAGMGKQADDNMCVSLCHYCHVERLHRFGERTFWSDANRTEEELIQYANNLYESYHV